MKKYLINGVLALFAGFYLASCAEKETDYVSIAEQKAKAFEEVFKEFYGEIDPHQDWGFGSGRIEVDPNDTSIVVEVVDLDGDIAYTRTVPFGGMNVLLAFNAGTRTDADGSGENKNLNEWGDPTKNNGKAYDVPDALTDGQKLRARMYFQTHPNLTYVDPGYTTFFVQQVYKGNPQTAGNLSTEEYTLGSGDVVTGSDHMDHLTFGLKSDGTYRHHVNDFNNGEWNNGTPLQVLNTGCSANDYKDANTEVKGKTHADQITLMVNSSTERVGYAESSASVQHNYCCALASAAVIDAWANNPANYVNGKPIGENCDDKWHRSFVGLDYEANEDPFTDDNGNKVVAKIGNAMPDNLQYAWTGTTYIRLDDNLKNMTLKQYFNLDEEVYFLQIKKNQWAGTADNYPQQSSIVKKAPKSEMDKAFPGLNANETTDVLDLTKIKDKLDLHRYPVYGKGFQEWYYGIGARDYVFSDWIVTLTNAGTVTVNRNEYITEDDTWTQIEAGRVFCEDLAKASLDDLDFNDVVFDVTVWENYTYRKEWWEKTIDGKVVDSGDISETQPATNYYASIILRAAGGTIPITVNGKDVHAQFKDGGKSVAEATMINTRDNKSTTFGSYISCEPVDLEGTDMKVRNYKVVKKPKNQVDQNEDFITLKMFKVDKQDDGKYIEKIPVWSSYGTAKQIQELGYVRGEAPKKFMVPKNSSSEYPKWTSERKNISLAYPGFGAWVQDATKVPWSNVNNNYTYDVEKPYKADGTNLPLVLKARKTVTTDGEEYLWSGSKEYKDNWNLAETTADLINQDRADAPAFEQFYPGDRLRFRAKDIKKDAWISVSIGNITPYFIDSEFPNYVKNADGSRETRTEGCVEVLLDQDACDKLNNFVVNGKITFTVMGRNFTLTGITRVLFQ